MFVNWIHEHERKNAERYTTRELLNSKILKSLHNLTITSHEANFEGVFFLWCLLFSVAQVTTAF